MSDPGPHATMTEAPFTGWTRQSWLDLSDRLVRGVWNHAGEDHANPRLPGPTGGYGSRVDSLEAFARSMQLAAIRLAGSDTDVLGAADWYARGLATGTDPASPHRWPVPSESGQARVEAASIALSFMLDPHRLWDPLPQRTQQHVIAWLEHAVGATDYPRTNWVWFQLLVEAFLRQVGGRWSREDIARCLAVHESFAETDGWYRDGIERSYDHYVGWALHTYPILLARLAPDLPGVAALAPLWRERLHRYLDDAVHLVGADGAPLMQGRSLIYRFGAAAPFWAGVLADATPLSPGLTRRVTAGLVSHFAGSVESTLTLGWQHEFAAMKQDYSGPGSPYWAGIGTLGLLLPATHPVWTAPEEPLPVERADFDRVLRAPGWLVSGTVADGVVRVVNHGTDHALPGQLLAESPWYSRLFYSTATAPDVTGAPGDVIDNQVALLDRHGRSSARTGLETLTLRPRMAVSRWRAHWVQPARGSFDFGTPAAGPVRYGPWLTVGSVLRGAVEVRACRIDPARDPLRKQAIRRLRGRVVRPSGVRFTGPPIGSGRAETASIRNVAGLTEHGVQTRTGANQLAERTDTAWLATGEPRYGRIYAAVIVTGVSPAPAPHLRVTADGVEVTWPDGLVDRLVLPAA